MFLIEFIAGVAATFAVLWLTWMAVERYDIIPPFLQFRPYNCRTCLTFWLTVGLAVTAALAGWLVAGVTMAVMAVLNGIAMHIDDKDRFDE